MAWNLDAIEANLSRYSGHSSTGQVSLDSIDAVQRFYVGEPGTECSILKPGSSDMHAIKESGAEIVTDDHISLLSGNRPVVIPFQSK